MILDNKKISPRQGFRISVLENITLGIVIIPYITTNLAGKWHLASLLIGLLLGGLYMALMYYLSTKVSSDVANIGDSIGGLGRGICLLYMVRFLIRAGVILLFFGKTMQEYLLQSFNLWVILIAFVLVCGYGAARDLEKRGRMLELLFLWMIVPLLLVAVFSISSISLQDLYDGLMGVNYESIKNNVSTLDVLKGGYVTFLIMTSSELMLFTLPHQKENNWRNSLKTGLWIVISLLLAYIFIIGILGGHWVSSDSQAALNVMEAAFVPGGVVERADYPVIAFWVIGVFAILSGYMFFAKEGFLLGTKTQNSKSGKIGIFFVMAGTVLFAWLWSKEDVSVYLAWYMLWADVIISILIPVVTLLCKRKKTSVLMLVLASALCFGGCGNETFKPLEKARVSIENRDYVTEISFLGNDKVTFFVADIKEYSSQGTGSFEVKEYTYTSDSLKAALNMHFDENGRQLDLGHINSIRFEGTEEACVRDYILEMSKNPKMGKSIKVNFDDDNSEIALRQLIKIAYAGENFP